MSNDIYLSNSDVIKKLDHITAKEENDFKEVLLKHNIEL